MVHPVRLLGGLDPKSARRMTLKDMMVPFVNEGDSDVRSNVYPSQSIIDAYYIF